ncbi:MAG: zinc-dependent metalloprotease [Bacteroidia bacterium]|nr:zinc-dependent metalloprotease [Bacteroidia bacterium]
MRKVVFLMVATAAMIPSTWAQFKSKKEEKTATPQAQDQPAKGKKTETIDNKVKGCDTIAGLFTLYRDTTSGELFMQISPEQLNKEFIHFTYTENGVLEAGHHRGAYRGSRIFKIVRKYESIEFIQQNTSFYFDPKNNVSKSANANISEAILAHEKIVAKDKSGNLLIAADELFLSEQLHQVVEGGRPGRGFELGRLAKGKTQYEKIKNYPANLDIVVKYVYDNASPKGGATEAVTDPRSVSILLQHSFMEVPNNDFKPRFDDYRIGYFSENVNDMTSQGFTNYRDLIHRWDLKKKDPNAIKSEPVKPIVWWIENTTPKELRPIIKHAALQWNKAFEPLGFINAVQVFEQPDDADWDAGDVRYNVLRWTSSPNPPFGGYGPSFVNPRTGEILGADIMLEYIFLTNRVRTQQIYGIEGAEMENENHSTHTGCDAGLYLHYQLQASQGIMNLQEADTIEMTRLLEESIHYLILHEMGHTMGLMHNMKASQVRTVEELNNPEITYKQGLIGSVMDYPAINMPSYGVKNKVQYCQVEPGPYDLWAIDYGYSLPLENEEDEQARLRNILSKSIQPDLTFGNDADDMRAPGKGLDPRVMINDLSGESVNFSAEKMDLIRSLMPKLLVKYGNGQHSYQPMVSVMNSLMSGYGTHAGIISRYIGGVKVERYTPGQAQGKSPYTAYSLAEQKAAMEALNKYIFAPNAFEISGEIAQHLQQQRRGFNFFASTEEPKIHKQIEGIQNSVMAHLLSPSVLNRMTDAKYLGNAYTVSDMLKDLTNAVFEADIKSLPNTHRRQLQTNYVKALVQYMDKPSNGLDAVASASIYRELKRIESMMKSGGPLSNPWENQEVNNHRNYIMFLIERGLDD